jgi:dihydrofolate synthase/folylpolyglutamate synthase
MGLERVERVLARLSLPRPQLVIHVAGTNGKGSSAAMLESLLRKRGDRVGCYTSPHIIHYNERIRVDGVDASDEQITAAFERVEASREDEPLTYFEFGTLAALIVFAEAGVTTAVLEVGMGGRLDAVNAVDPDVGLITNIALDHCAWLGDDVEAIAFEKAGIMRNGKPVVFGERTIPAAILRHADDVGADLIAAGRDFDWSAHGGHWSWKGVSQSLEELANPALPGEHQLGNAAGVLAVLEAAGFVPEVNVVNDALGSLRLPGRMQEIDFGARWVLDVAHNPAAAQVLGKTLDAQTVAGKTVAIIAMLDDKDVEGCVMPLRHQVDYWIATTADSPRAIAAGELARRVANTTNSACQVADTPEEAIARARTLTDVDDRVLVTGSFYLVGPVLERL